MSKGVIKSLFFIFFAWFASHLGYIILDGLNDENKKSEFAVVLGTTVNEDGTLSPRLKARLDAGLELHQKGLVEYVYVSGGLGKEGFYEGTEMKKYLVLSGVKPNHVYVDNDGVNTRATAVNFGNEFPEAKSVVVVSQFFHVSRTKLAFRQVGVENVTGVHADYFECRDLYSTVREFFGYYWYFVFC